MARPPRPIVPLTDEQKKLAEQYLPLAHWALKRWPQIVARYQDSDDALQEALYAVCKAARIYDPARGVKFITLATRCIWGELHNGVRLHHVRSEYPGDTHSMEWAEMGGRLVLNRQEAEPQKTVEMADSVRVVLRKMSARQRQAMKLHLKHQNLAEVGRRMGGISKEAVRQLLEKGKIAARARLNPANFAR